MFEIIHNNHDFVNFFGAVCFFYSISSVLLIIKLFNAFVVFLFRLCFLLVIIASNLSNGFGVAMFFGGLKSELANVKQRLVEADNKLSSIDRSMAIIEFELGGTIIHANDNFLKALGGYQLAEIVGKHHRMFVPPSERESPEYRDFWLKLAQGQFLSSRFKRVAKNGDIVWIQATYNPIFDSLGHPYKVVKLATNITQEVMKESEIDAQMAAIHRSLAVIEFDLQGNVLTANANFSSVMGFTLSEIQGKHHAMFVDAIESKSKEYADFWKDLGNGKVVSSTFKRFGKNRKPVWLEASYNPVYDADGKVYKVVKFAADVTEQEQRKQDLSRAVTDASGVLLALAEGDLTKDMPSGVYKGELHDLKNALNYTIDRFKRIVAETIESANIVSNAASQVSTGASDLSARVQEQAAALEETSATMNEMAAAVQINTEHARKVAELALSAQIQTTGGTQVVQKTIDAMNAIRDSSNRITDIVTLIDGIAFQTNLLALNAAVEAARAGEHGRGFAVVASEVRALAQKSATAAQDIKDLINDSSERVVNGQLLAEESGKTLDGIAQLINQVSSMIGQIATASHEQSIGINQVHQAIAQIDDVTQQNAALVEETTASAENLSDEAHKLQENMSVFKLA